MRSKSITVELTGDTIAKQLPLQTRRSTEPNESLTTTALLGAVPVKSPGAADNLPQGIRNLSIWLPAALLVLFLTLPVGALIARALAPGSSWDAESFGILRQALRLSMLTTGFTMAIVIALGTPLAYLLARRRFPGATAVEALVDLPIVLPPAVAGIALLVAFGRNGVIGQWLAAGGITLGFTTAAVVMAQVFVSAPFYVIAARAGFARVDQDVEAAAADLGATPGRVFRTVTLPLIAPSLIAGAVLAWARALGEFGATIMFAGNFPGVTQTMPLAIYGQFGAGDMPTALLLSVVLLVSSFLVLVGVRTIGGRMREGF